MSTPRQFVCDLHLPFYSFHSFFWHWHGISLHPTSLLHSLYFYSCLHPLCYIAETCSFFLCCLLRFKNPKSTTPAYICLLAPVSHLSGSSLKSELMCMYERCSVTNQWKPIMFMVLNVQTWNMDIISLMFRSSPVESDSGTFSPLVQFLWAGLHTAITLVLDKYNNKTL